MSKPPKVVIPGLNRGAGIPPGYILGRRRGTGKGPAELLDLTQMKGAGLATTAQVTQVVDQLSTALSMTTAAGPPGFGLDGQDGEEGMPLPGPQGAIGPMGPAGSSYASRALMAARLAPTADDVVHLGEPGREGPFVVDVAASWTAAIIADTAQGLYVISTADATKVYRRVFNGAPNVRWFGATGDGTTDDTAAFNAAHTVAALVAAAVYAPPTAGQYLLAGTVTAKVSMFGDGQATVLKTSSATADVVQVGAPNVTITDLQITSTVTRTAGYYINFNGVADNSNYNSRIERCTFGSWFNCIGFTGAGALNTIRIVDCWLTTSTPLGIGITFKNGAPAVDVVLRDVFIIGGGALLQPNIGVSLDYVGDILLDHVSTVYCSLGLNVAPTGSHTAESVFINNCLFDSGGNSGIRVGGSTGTTVNLVQIHNTWSCTNTKGLLMNGSGAIQRVEVVGGYFCNNATGAGIKADVVQYLDVIGGTFAANTNGISIAAGVSNFKIQGARCGPAGLFSANSGYGIAVAAGASTNYLIEGNDLTGNTTGALSNEATGTGIVGNNLGVVPLATSPVGMMGLDGLDGEEGMPIPGAAGATGAAGAGGVSVIGYPLLSATQTPGVNFYIMTFMVVDTALTINKVAFAMNAASATSKLQAFVYVSNAAGVPGALLGSSAQQTGVAAGYNEISLSAPVVLTKGTMIWIGLNVTTAALTGMWARPVGLSAFAANGSSTVPSDPAPAVTTFTTANAIYAIWGVT